MNGNSKRKWLMLAIASVMLIVVMPAWSEPLIEIMEEPQKPLKYSKHWRLAGVIENGDDGIAYMLRGNNRRLSWT